MEISDHIDDKEKLGRDVFSNTRAKKARNSGNISYEIFLHWWGSVEISVDRLDFAERNEMAAISRVRERNRSGPFCGWAVVTKKKAASEGRKVEAAPEFDNPYHANIILPDAAAEYREEQISHAKELAKLAVWHEPPEEG